MGGVYVSVGEVWDCRDGVSAKVEVKVKLGENCDFEMRLAF